MGLCKCPKRKVSTLFCFEHRVNVCENCLVTDHSQCVVQSYLQWLQDSDYDASCFLCSQLLSQQPTIRFLCLHNFHINCIDNHFSKLPKNTAPNGYLCPVCNECIFFSNKVKSPLADDIRKQLQHLFKHTKFPFNLQMISSDVPSAIVDMQEPFEVQKQTKITKKDDFIKPPVLSNGFSGSTDARLHHNYALPPNEMHHHHTYNKSVRDIDVSGFLDKPSLLLNGGSPSIQNANSAGNDDWEDKHDKAGQTTALGRRMKLILRRMTYDTLTGRSTSTRKIRTYLLLAILAALLVALFYVVIYDRDPTTHIRNHTLLRNVFNPKGADEANDEYGPDAQNYRAVEQDYLKNPMLDPNNNPNIHVRRRN